MYSTRHSNAPNTEHLTIVGEATLQFVPDLIELRLAITRIDEAPATAKADVDERAAKAIRIARDNAVDTKDIRASQLSLAPHREYRNGEHKHKGYAAALELRLKIRDIASFNRLLGELVGIPIDRIVGIDAQLQDESAARQAALAAAIDDAKAKAARVASQFGVTLDGVYSVAAMPKEERFHIGGGAARGATEDATFEPGTIDIEGRIEVTFYLAKSRPH